MVFGGDKKNEDDNNHKRTKVECEQEHVGKPNLIAFPNKDYMFLTELRDQDDDNVRQW